MDEIYYDSPIGSLRITASEIGLTEIHFPAEDESMVQEACGGHRSSNLYLKSAVEELNRYFERELETFSTPVDLKGTPFQVSVWKELSQIPFGTTVGYGEIAKRIGNPKASRAVGMANNRNPISIIMPCHRVIGSDGKLIGFGGGIWRKEWLLRHEGVLL